MAADEPTNDDGVSKGRSPFAANLFGLPLLCAGLCLIAACLLLPQAEANRRLAVDRDQLRQDLAHADAQLAVNAGFLEEAAADPEITERLAQRQSRQIRQGTAALHLSTDSAAVRAVESVTAMLRVPTPPPVAAYAPPTGWAGDLVGDARRQLYGLGVGLFLVAVGLILGASEPTPASEIS